MENRESLRFLYEHPDIAVVNHWRERDRRDVRATVAQGFECVVEGCDCVGMDSGIGFKEMADHADANSLEMPDQWGRVVGNRNRCAGWVGGIMPGDSLQHQRAIASTARHRSRCIERVGQRKDACSADPTIGGLQAGDAAQAGRNSD